MDTNAHTLTHSHTHTHIHSSNLPVAFMYTKVLVIISLFIEKSKSSEPYNNTCRDIGARVATLFKRATLCL